MASRSRVLNLYRELLRESGRFSTYNYRMYALRRVKDAFRENKGLQDSVKIEEVYGYGQRNLEVIKRQVLIGHLYESSPLVIEGHQPKKAVRT